MKKRITIDFETEEDNSRIMSWMNSWARDSFQSPEIAKIKIEDVEDDKAEVQ